MPSIISWVIGLHVLHHRVVLLSSDPLPPIDVTVSDVTSTSVTVSWTPDSKSVQDSYELRYKGTNQASTWTTAESVTGEQRIVDELVPGDQYTFEVKAVSNTRKSDPSIATAVLSKYLGIIISFPVSFT